MATIYVNIAVEIEIPDEDLPNGYDNHPVQWAFNNIDVNAEGSNVDWWVDNMETIYDD